MYGHLGLWYVFFLHPTIYLFPPPNYSFIEDRSPHCGIKSSHGLNYIVLYVVVVIQRFLKTIQRTKYELQLFFAIM